MAASELSSGQHRHRPSGRWRPRSAGAGWSAWPTPSRTSIRSARNSARSSRRRVVERPAAARRTSPGGRASTSTGGCAASAHRSTGHSSGPFARRVLQATAAIPYGGYLSYGEVAAEAGSPRGARAAGNALGSNPVALVDPLPPRAGRRRRDRRLWRRDRAQADAARARGHLRARRGTRPRLRRIPLRGGSARA